MEHEHIIFISIKLAKILYLLCLPAIKYVGFKTKYYKDRYEKYGIREYIRLLHNFKNIYGFIMGLKSSCIAYSFV